MSEQSKAKTQPSGNTKSEKQPGFFGRLFQKLDDSMKQKAETKSQQGSCCGGNDGKGGKCC